jgi:ferredoxin
MYRETDMAYGHVLNTSACAVKMFHIQRALFQITLLIGCGACEFACPVKPYTAIFVDGNDVQKVAVPPVIEELDNTLQEDFLF